MNEINSENLFRRRNDCIGAPVDGGYVMLDLDSGRYLQLNPVGTVIWDLLETPQTLRTLCNTLQARFDVGRQECSSEVSALIGRLLKLNLIRLEG